MDGYLQQKIKYVSQSCHEIKVLLEADQTHFGDNNVKSLADSNQKKSLLLEQLVNAVNELQAHQRQYHPGKSLESLDATPAYAEMIATLKSELNHCFQALAVNNHIVFANLQQLKGIWDQILSSQKSTDCLYDHTGILGK